MFRTVFVDVDNTLLDFQACSKECISHTLKEYGIECTDHIIDTFHRINDGLWLEVENGTLTRDRLYDVRFQRIFSELGLDLPSAEFESKFRAGLNICAVPFPDAQKLMQYLYGKYTVCIASNAHQDQQSARLERAGLLKYSHHLFTSEAMGAEKPSSAFFEACFARIPGASPETAVMLGDSLTADMRGAIGYGMGTIWFDRLMQNDSGEFRVDHIVHDLSEVMRIL